ncbi:CoA transferase subunit A [Aerococcaceae bacterium DSM 111020]|nr:CoA transferase subunit A [Aerococcaceae bacterium DSM 111020]
MAEIISIEEAVAYVKPGSRIMGDGFLGISAPIKLFEGLRDAGTKELTLIQAVMSFPMEEHDVSLLAVNKQLKKLICAHAGTSREITKQYFAGELEIDFIPMGTLAECIRAAGAGLGGVITPVGIGTMQEENHEKITRNGKDYLLYNPIGADVAFVKANKADKAGNLYCHGTSKSLTLEVAMAADIVIAEVDEIVEIGEIEPTDVYVPGMLVDYLVQGLTPEENFEYYKVLWGRHNLLSEGANE